MRITTPTKTFQIWHWAIITVLIFSFFINIYGIWWGLPSFYGWAADEVIPKKVLAGIEQNFSQGWHGNYPPFHYYLLAFLYLPILVLEKLGLVNTESLPVYTILFFLGRLLSTLMGTAIVGLVYSIGQQIYDKKASLFAALTTALICTSIYYSKVVNVEIPYIFWFVLSLLFYIKILKHHRIYDYLLFSITATVSICTKDQAYGFYVLTAIFIVLNYYFYRRNKNKSYTLVECLTDRRISLSLLVGILLFVIFHNIIFNPDGFIAYIQLNVSDRSHEAGTFFTRRENNFLEHFKLLIRSLREIQFSLGWPLFLLSLLGLTTALVQKRKNFLLLSLLIPAISYYLFFISVILYTRDRFLIPLCIILAFFCGKLLSELLNKRLHFYWTKLILIVLIFFYTFIYSFSVNILMTQDSRYYVENWMKQNLDKNSQVLYVGGRKYFPRFEFQNFSDPVRSISASFPKDLEEKEFDYIITTSSYDINRFEKSTEVHKAFARLNQEKSGYKLKFKYQSKPRWNFLKLEEIRPITDKRYKTGNLNKINPEIKIFQKIQ